MEILKEYRNILLDQNIIIYTDYLNLLYTNTTSIKRVQWWKLLLEEYEVEIRYIKGDQNVVAKSLSYIKINKMTQNNQSNVRL